MGWILGLVLALSLFIRSVSISSVPPELFGDELDVGYQAYSLITTGRDLYRQPFPILVHSLSEWRLPLIVYYTTPAVALLGLTEVAIRLPEVIMGGLGSIIIYLLTYQITRRRSTALTTAFLLTFLPWHFLYSRMAAFGVVSQLNFLMLGTIFYLRRRPLLTAIFFGLSLYTYGTALVFVPLWLIGLWLSTRRPILKSLCLTALISTPLIYLSFFGSAASRFQHIGVFSASEVMESITSYRTRHPDLIGRIFYNRPLVYLRLISTNYLQAYSPEFLFIRGDPAGRHSLQIVGGLYPMLAPFLLWGLVVLLRRQSFIPLIWLLLAPLPSALTQGGGFHATRLFLMVAPMSIIIATGLTSTFATLYRLLWGRLTLAVVTLIVVFSLIRVSYYYFADYPSLSWRWWQPGYKSAITVLASLAPNYSRVFINNSYEPSLIRFLFWTRYPPAKFHANFTLDQPLTHIAPEYDGFTLDGKYFFGSFSSQAHTDGVGNHFLPGALYLISQRDDVGGDWDWRSSPPSNVSVLHTVVDPNGQPLFYLVSRL